MTTRKPIVDLDCVVFRVSDITNTRKPILTLGCDEQEDNKKSTKYSFYSIILFFVVFIIFKLVVFSITLYFFYKLSEFCTYLIKTIPISQETLNAGLMAAVSMLYFSSAFNIITLKLKRALRIEKK